MEQAGSDSILIGLLRFDCVDTDVQRAIQDCLHSGKRLGIACSGGADSVFLLRWILACLPTCRRRLTVLHFDHRARGTASASDADWIRNTCKSLQLQCVIGTRKPSSPDSPLPVDEASLRQARLAFFQRATREHSVNLILTAHHSQDRVEALLMRLSRASALEGLIAPKPVQAFRNGMRIARPLLSLNPDSLRDCLRTIGQEWREDATNGNTRYYRNFVRNELLPLWQSYIGPTLIPQLTASIQTLEADLNGLDTLAETALQGIDLSKPDFPLPSLRHHPRAILRRCIRRWLQEHPGAASCSHHHIDSLLELQDPGPMQLTRDWEILLRPNGTLRLQSTHRIQPFAPLQFALGDRGQLWFPDGNCLKCERIRCTPALYQQITDGADRPSTQVHLHADVLPATAALWVRFWEDGMRYQPLGSPHEQKLKACFINRKVPRALRRRLPVVCNPPGEVIWVPGLLPAQKARVRPNSKDLLRLTYQRS